MNSYDNTILNQPKLKIRTKISRWDSYTFEILNDTLFIVGKNEKDDSELFHFETADYSSILFSLLNLRQKLSKEVLSCSKQNISKVISKSDLKLIRKFCKRNGLPFWNFKETNNVFCNDSSDHVSVRYYMLYDVIPFSKENRLPIFSFITGLNQIYLDFLKIVASEKKYANNNNILIYLDDEGKNFIQKYQNSDYEHRISLYTPALSSFVTLWNEGESCLQMNCENLFALTAYYLAAIFQTKNLNSGYIRICPKCNGLFVADDSRQKYCHAPCTKQSYYKSMKKNKM